jgi:hypothetical protein
VAGRLEPKTRRVLTFEIYADARAGFLFLVMLIVCWWASTMFVIEHAENKATEKFFDVVEWCAEKPGRRRKINDHLYLDCSLGCSALLDLADEDEQEEQEPPALAIGKRGGTPSKS